MEDGIPGRLQHHHEMCCKKGGRRGRRACRVQRWHHHGDVVFQTGGLVYDNFDSKALFNNLESYFQHVITLFFYNPLNMFIPISFPMNQKLYTISLFLIIPDFLYFLFFFSIDNIQQQCWIHILFLELWFSTSYQQTFIEHVVNYLSF